MERRSLRIAVADDEPEMLEWLRETLSELGHQVVAAVPDGNALVEACRENPPDLIITDIRMPGMDGIEAAQQITKEHPLPVILVSAYHDPELLDRAVADHVLAYLVKPIKQADLETTIALAMQRFREFEALQKEAADLRQALQDRKLIERAKGILMRRAGLDEADAFRRLQRLSSEKNTKMAQIAQMIITAEEALG